LRAQLNPQRRDKTITPERVQDVLDRLAAHDPQGSSPVRVVRSRGAILGLPLASLPIRAA
jgi:hypothetical protein